MRLGRLSALAAACALIGAQQAAAAPFEPISTSGVGLTKTGLGQADYDKVAKLEAKFPRTTVGAVIKSANRKVRTLGTPPELKGVKSVAGGFRFNKGDSNVSYWWPQGITGSADAVPGGVVDGYRSLLVSWYSKDGRGARVSFVNAGSLKNATYRHVLLVEPDAAGGFDVVNSHAGGIAWYGNYLYVAQTGKGLRVFDMRRILRVPNPDDALGYAFILPQVGLYKSTKKGLVFSFVSVDRGGPALVTGEYRKSTAGGRIVRWPLDGASGLLKGGQAQAAYASPAGSMQGALALNGKLGASSSAGEGNPGVFTTGVPGKATVTRPWAAGVEDVSYAPTSGRVYSLTEYPGARSVFGVSASSLGF